MKRFKVSEFAICKDKIVTVNKILPQGKVEITWYDNFPDYYGYSDFQFFEIVKSYELKRYNKKNYKKTFYKDMVKTIGQYVTDMNILMTFN